MGNFFYKEDNETLKKNSIKDIIKDKEELQQYI